MREPSTQDGRFEGRIYNADNGKSYDVEVWSDRPAELTVKGCMLALFCGSQTWKRATDTQPNQLLAATDTASGPTADREWAAKTAAGVTAKPTTSR